MNQCRSAWSASRNSARITHLPGTIRKVPDQVAKMAPAAGTEVRRCRQVSAGVCFQFCFQNTCSFRRQPATMTSPGHEEQTASAASSTSTGWWPELGERGLRHPQVCRSEAAPMKAPSRDRHRRQTGHYEQRIGRACPRWAPASTSSKRFRLLINGNLHIMQDHIP